MLWQAAVSIHAHHLAVPRGGCLCCFVLQSVMETNTKVRVLHTNFRAWLEKSPSQCCSTPLLASSGIDCHSHNTAVQNMGAAQWYNYDDVTVLWCGFTIASAFFGQPDLALHQPTLPLIQARVRVLTWLFHHWKVGGQRQVHPPFLFPQLMGLSILSIKTTELSWTSLHAGRYMGYLYRSDLPFSFPGPGIKGF